MKKIDSIICIFLALTNVSLAQGHWEFQPQLKADMGRLTTKGTDYNPKNFPVSTQEQASLTLGGGMGISYCKEKKFGFDGFATGLFL
ncbi:MAG: hypothetical protein JST36_08330 [Bacteroidetes bacterium]|nr:hypothetical protein [Bacteroidota bacterium]